MRSLETTNAKKLITQTLNGLGLEGREIATLFSNGSKEALSSIANRAMPDPASDDFPRAYAAWSLLRKSTLLEHGVDKSEVAYAAFATTEYKCHLVNNRRGTAASDSITKSIGESVMFHAQRKIGEVLGEFSLEEYFSACDHTGGASTQRKRESSSMKNKWSDIHQVTYNAAHILGCFHNSVVAAPKVMQLVTGSSAFTVPKDAKTDRLIFKEPQGNMFLQKGLGTMIRRRLKRCNINLNDQSVNQQLASDLRYATIDLSNASNLISRSTVALLLQKAEKEWLYMLESTRCAHASFDNGETYTELEMFSGMGNGFTFELESLLFYALAWASVHVESLLNGYNGTKVVSVYGDDIIVGANVYDTLTTALQYCGFEVNELKSYAKGPFRESCGRHYLAGRDITPVSLKDRDFSRLEDWYYLYNTLRDLNDRLHLTVVVDVLNRIKKVLKGLNLCNFVPPHYSREAGLHASFDEACPSLSRKPRRRNSPWYGGYTCTVYQREREIYRVDELGAYLCALRGTGRLQSSQSSLKWYALQFICDTTPIYRVYRPGSSSCVITQGEGRKSDTFVFKRAIVRFGEWT